LKYIILNTNLRTLDPSIHLGCKIYRTSNLHTRESLRPQVILGTYFIPAGACLGAQKNMDSMRYYRPPLKNNGENAVNAKSPTMEGPYADIR